MSGKYRCYSLLILLLLMLSLGVAYGLGYVRLNSQPKIGDPIDSLNHVYVYYNGAVSHVDGRNLGKDGYNIGLKYQCVEFVKRYYYEYLNHRMPDTYGHAKDFFMEDLADGALNKKRDLIQYTNPGIMSPHVNDILIFDGSLLNPYGHVAIVSSVYPNAIEMIQQNGGPHAFTRVVYPLEKRTEGWYVDAPGLKGWLHKKIDP